MPERGKSDRPVAIVTALLVTGLVIVVGAIIVIGIVTTSRAREEATKTLARTQRLTATADAATEFLRENLIDSVEAIDPDERDATVITILDAASQRLDGRFDDAPQVETAVRLAIGIAYEDVGAYDQAVGHLERAVELHELHGTEPDDRLFTGIVRLARAHARRSDLDAAAKWGRRALILAEDEGRLGDVDAIIATIDLANVLFRMGLLDNVEPLLNDAIERGKRVRGEDDPVTLAALDAMARLFAHDGRHREGAAIIQRVLDVRRSELGPQDPVTLDTMGALARAWTAFGRYRQARPVANSALETSRRAFGDEDPVTLRRMTELAELQRAEGERSEAEMLIKVTISKQRNLLGDEHPDTLDSTRVLAGIYADAGRYEDAAAVLEENVRRRGLREPENHPDLVDDRATLAAALAALGEHAAAATLFEQVLAARREAVGGKHALAVDAKAGLAAALVETGEYAKAETLFREVLERRERRLGTGHPDTLRAMYGLIRALAGLGEDDEVRTLSEVYRRGSAIWRGQDVELPDLDDLQ